MTLKKETLWKFQNKSIFSKITRITWIIDEFRIFYGPHFKIDPICGILCGIQDQV